MATNDIFIQELGNSPIWITDSTMVADTFSRLCIIPADKHLAMTNREMVMADINLFEVVDIESRR